VQLILWDTDTDALEYGQWLKGRVYERRCDLSPDGKLFLYFAQKKHQRRVNIQEYTYAWTAVSRPPYFTALALWPKGDCWNGGGSFDDNTTISLNHNPERMEPHPDHRPKRLTVIPGFVGKGEDSPIYSKLLTLNGWNVTQEGVEEPNEGRQWWRWRLSEPRIWEKRHRELPFTLLMKLYGSDHNQVGDDLILEFVLKDERTGEMQLLNNARWADWDQRGRLVYIAKGLLLSQSIDPRIKSPNVIADLNAQSPKLISTPAWAYQW
jgi:hypothetical protein